ncbi:MAG: ComF family protein [Bacteroidota bacterium]
MMKIENQDWRNWFRQIGNGLVELIFPPPQLCPVCNHEESVNNGLGSNCLRRIAFIRQPFCLKCGRPKRLAAAEKEYCRQCEETDYYFSQARAVAAYEGALREYLTDLKYRFRPDLGPALGVLLVEWFKINRNYQKPDLIIPIPIHWQKLIARGYNQAELLANPLQKYLGIPLKNDIILREKMTESQNMLQKAERFANIRGAFRVTDTRLLSGARVLLIDDIFTTGATVSEASRVLMRAGALEVKVLTLAGGVLDSEWVTN